MERECFGYYCVSPGCSSVVCVDNNYDIQMNCKAGEDDDYEQTLLY